MNDGDTSAKEIETLILSYFTALRTSTPEGITQVFHPSAQVIGAPKGGEHITPATDLAEFVRKTPAPSDREELEDMEYEILYRTDSTAAVRFRVFYLGIYVTDLLLLAKFASGWKIVAKTYHQELEE